MEIDFNSKEISFIQSALLYSKLRYDETVSAETYGGNHQMYYERKQEIFAEESSVKQKLSIALKKIKEEKNNDCKSKN